MKNTDLIVVQDIWHAQYFSTKAKRVNSYEASQKLYDKKDECLLHAVSILKTTKNSRIRWKQERQLDRNLNWSLVLYFEFNYKGKHYQFSFHNFCFHTLGRQSKGDPTIKWEGIFGKCRRDFAEIRRFEKKR